MNRTLSLASLSALATLLAFTPPARACLQNTEDDGDDVELGDEPEPLPPRGEEHQRAEERRQRAEERRQRAEERQRQRAEESRRHLEEHQRQRAEEFRQRADEIRQRAEAQAHRAMEQVGRLASAVAATERRSDRGPLVAVQRVTGPVTVRLRALDAQIMVTPSAGMEVSVRLEHSDATAVRLVPQGDRVEVEIDGRGGLRSGVAVLAVPPRSRVELSTISGGISVIGVGGEVALRTVSGDVRVARAGSLQVRTISGSVQADEVAGDTRVATVSGDARIRAAGDAKHVEYTSTSGDLTWSGRCGAGCRLEARTMSGDLELGLDPASSFDMYFLSHSGSLSDGLAMTVVESAQRPGGESSFRARDGGGEGMIECQTFSGDLTLRKR